MACWLMQGSRSSSCFNASHIFSVTSRGGPGLEALTIRPCFSILARAVRIVRVEQGTIVLAISLSVTASTPCNLLMMTFSGSARWIFDNLGAMWSMKELMLA